MRRNQKILIAAFGFVSAIFISSFIKLGFSVFLLLLVISLALFLFKFIFAKDIRDHGKVSLIALFILFFGLGIFRYELKDNVFLDQNLEDSIGKKVNVEALIIDEPSKKESQATLIVDIKTLNNVRENLLVKGKTIVSTGLYPEYKYGDLINISGTLKKPENFTSSSSLDFDYISYLAKDDIYYKIDFAKISLISSGNGNPIKLFLLKIKDSFTDNINKAIKEPESSLLSGILLGAKSSLNKETANIFRIAGLSHIVALSGYNITIVAEALMKILSFLPRTAGLVGAIAGIISFVVMSGASSTAVRAGIMSLIVVLAQITRRNYQIDRALIAAGLIMIIINPKVLVFDISFQLSFLATIAIIYLSPILKNKLYFVTDRFGLKDIISATISAQILVLPLIIYKMGMLSLVALPANILVLPVIPLTMFFGFITGILGFVFGVWSLFFGLISSILLSYIISVSRFFANLPFSHLNISNFSAVAMSVCYVLIFTYIIYENRKLEISKS